MANWGISEQGWRKGPWTPEEDKLLIEYVGMNGEGRWSCVSKCTRLNRSGKSCRLRWVNYLRPGLKKGHMTPQEEGIIIELHAIWGNKWSTIARYLPGRTDNEIKNYWRTHFKKRKPTNEIKQEKKKLIRQKLEQQAQVQDCNKNVIINTSPQEAAYDEHKSEKVEMDNIALPIIENHQILPVLCQDNPSWTDFVQFDNLWGGLWNFEDQINGCSKMAIQNQASNAGGGYSCEGDGNNYMHNGGYIFG